MSNKPELVIAGSIDEDGSTISMIHMNDSKDPGGYAFGYLDENEVLTFTFVAGYYSAEAFETQLARTSAPEAVPCPDLSEDSAWVTKVPYHSILEFDTGRIRLTYDQNMTFNFHDKSNCNIFGFNTWRSEREGGPYNQEVVAVVSSRKSPSGEIQLFGAQLGTFATYNMPMYIKDDGTLNCEFQFLKCSLHLVICISFLLPLITIFDTLSKDWALTAHTGGPLYDYFSTDATQEFFDPQFLTSKLDDIKTTQGVDLEADFTDPYPDSDLNLNTGTDMWQVLMNPVIPDPPLNKSDPTTTYAFDQLSSEFGTGTEEERTSLMESCEYGQSMIGAASEWMSPEHVEAAVLRPSGAFNTFTTISKLKIEYWAPKSNKVPTNSCYFAGVLTYLDSTESEIVAAVIGSVDGGSDGTLPLRLEMVQGGPCKASFVADLMSEDEMKVTYGCTTSHWEDADSPDKHGVIFQTVLKRLETAHTTEPAMEPTTSDVFSCSAINALLLTVLSAPILFFI